MSVKREELLEVLQAVSSGLADKPIIEQSDCFVFQGDSVIAFNDEIAVQSSNPLDIEGAVDGRPLLDLLSKLSEEALEIAVGGGGLNVKGKGRRANVRMESEIVLPVDEIEQPEKWRKVPSNVLKALRTVYSCCSMDETHFVFTCVHVAGDRVEAGSNVSLIRCPVRTGVKRPFLLRRIAVEKVCAMQPTQWAQTSKWIHFRKDDLVMSVRRYDEKFMDISKFLDVDDGAETSLPKDLEDVLSRAQIFTTDDPLNNRVKVVLSPGRMMIEGSGASGWYKEKRKLPYEGRALTFEIEPKLLLDICKRSEKCTVGDNRIRIESEDFVFVASLYVVPEEIEED